jgi:hypothetical protein
MSNKETRIIIGEIGNSDEDALTENSLLLLNRDEDEAGAELKLLAIDESVQNYSLFEGEIVGFEGMYDQKRFVAQKILKPKPITKAVRSTKDFKRVNQQIWHLQEIVGR